MPLPPLTKAYSSRGADMGRPNRHAVDRTAPIKFHLARVPFVDGCYDRGGAYWGGPANLYRAYSVEGAVQLMGNLAEASRLGHVEIFLRARNREWAKQLVIRERDLAHPTAHGYRRAIFFR